MNIQVIVLAAGLSRRMGPENKLLLPFKNHTILAEVIQQLSQTRLNALLVVLGHEEREVKKALAPFKLTQVFNPRFAEGQSSSIQAGVKALPAGTDGFIICLGDMPKISGLQYQRLFDDFQAALSSNKPLIMRPFHDKQPGHPVCFSAHFKKAILKSREADGCRAVIQNHKEALQKWSTKEPAYFWDLDTREDYDQKGY